MFQGAFYCHDNQVDTCLTSNFQTGSGKTYTITGGAEKYADRGIIPRILSYVFDYYKTVCILTLRGDVDLNELTMVRIGMSLLR